MSEASRPHKNDKIDCPFCDRNRVFLSKLNANIVEGVKPPSKIRNADASEFAGVQVNEKNEGLNKPSSITVLPIRLSIVELTNLLNNFDQTVQTYEDDSLLNDTNDITAPVALAEMSEILDDYKKRSSQLTNNSNQEAIDHQIVAIENKIEKSKRKRVKRKKSSPPFYADYKCCIYLNRFRELIRNLIYSKLFTRFIITAILINTFSMSIEHHNQPKLLTMIVEYSNYVFTLIFLIEMILKMLGDGLIKYIKDAFNIFDAVIVCLRYV